jgi:hypothetical protein
MVSKSDIVNNIPASGSINEVADGDIVSAAVENFNNQALLNFVSLLYKFVRDDAAALSVSNTFTAAQVFDILQAAQIRPAILNGDLILNPNGSGKFRYADGSSDTEIASKGYVQGVSFAAGNVPGGGTASTWLEGNASWSDPRTFTPWEIETVNFTAVDKGQYSMNAGVNAQLPAPTATFTAVFKPAIGQDFTVTPGVLVRAGSEQIAGDAANYTMDINAEFKVTSNGTDYDVSIAPIGRV